MPRRKRSTERPWVVENDDRLSPAGRPRLGPRGKAVRELPRLTIRAERAVIRRWLALVGTDDRPGPEIFRAVVDAAISQLPDARQAEVNRRARAIAREDVAE